MTDLSVIILTHNEEHHIERAVRSVAPLAEKLFVVDSFSTDRTCEIARALGAEVVQHAFVTQSQQFQWALDNLPIETDWVMRLDADEVLTFELASEIAHRLARLPTDVAGVNLRRRHIFMGRWIAHGGRYPLILMRIWRRGAARVEERWMDEHVVLKRGRAVTFKHDFCDHNLSDLTSFIRKHNAYATREAIDVLAERYHLFNLENKLSINTTSVQVAVRRLVKNKVYNKMPLWLGPLGYFLSRYTVQLGFLDGLEGLIYHFLQGFWYRFLVGVKVEELDRVLRNLPAAEIRRAELARLSGYSSIDLMTAHDIR